MIKYIECDLEYDTVTGYLSFTFPALLLDNLDVRVKYNHDRSKAMELYNDSKSAKKKIKRLQSKINEGNCEHICALYKNTICPCRIGRSIEKKDGYKYWCANGDKQYHFVEVK